MLNRLKKEAEEKGMIPESQAGFRKRRSALDNVFVHVMQREKRQERMVKYICF